MRQMLRTLWHDDGGAVIAVEYLFFTTIIVFGTIIGLASLREAINIELTETANALLAVSQGFVISGGSGSGGSFDGSEVIDTPGSLSELTNTPPPYPSLIDVTISP